MANNPYKVKCYICGELTDGESEVIQTTIYTLTPIRKLVKTFIGSLDTSNSNKDDCPAADNDSTQNSTDSNANMLCQACINKINEYDLAIVTAKRIENELKEIYLATVVKNDSYDDYRANAADSELDHDDSKYSVISVLIDSIDSAADENFDSKIDFVSSINEECYDNNDKESKRRHKKRKSIIDNSDSDAEEQDNNDKDEDYLLKATPKKPKLTRSKNSDKTDSNSAKRKIGRPRKQNNTSTDDQKPDNDDENKPTAKNAGDTSDEEDYFPFDDANDDWPIQRKRGRPRKGEKPIVLKPKKVTPKTVKNANSFPKQCETCLEKFEKKSEWQEHIKSHQCMSESIICDICGQIYKTKASLKYHVGIHHGQNLFECELCNKKFTQKGALVRHMPLHTGERPHQCDKCGKQYLHYSSFHMHQLAHDNIRQKKCSICGMSLRSKSHLTRHMRVHTGEKPFECPICGQKFAQRYFC